MRMTSMVALVAGLAGTIAPGAGGAAELRVLAGGALTAALQELGPRFERASGHRVVLVFAATPQLIAEATSGQPFDLGVVPVDVMRDEAARARFARGATTDVARVGFGIAVRAGTPKPEIGTADLFKRALLAARSIALLPESAAGAYVLSVFDRLGIAAEMRDKTKRQATPAAIPQAVANGEAELGIFLMNVLAAPGVELAGPFPAELQRDLVFTAAIAAETKEAAPAQSFIAYLRTPEAAEVLRAKGLTPG